MRVTTKPSPNRYTDDFRSDALNLIRRGDRSFRQRGVDLGVNSWTLRDWWKKELMRKSTKPKASPVEAAPAAKETEAQELSLDASRMRSKPASKHRAIGAALRPNETPSPRG